MVIENRLKILASQIKVQKRKGFIHEWPEVIKNEAVLLMAEVGIKKLIDSTCLPRSLIYVWRNKIKISRVKINEFKPEAEKILVTKIIANNNVLFNNKSILATIEKEGVKLNIYCKDTAIDILEKLLK